MQYTRRIASEQRESERRKREFNEIEKAVSVAKQKFKQETTEVMLGERDQVSAEVAAAQMLGYRNELIRQQRGRSGRAASGAGPRVREPEGGLGKDKLKDREMYRKRQAAGGGSPPRTSPCRRGTGNWRTRRCSRGLAGSEMRCKKWFIGALEVKENSHKYNAVEGWCQELVEVQKLFPTGELMTDGAISQLQATK